MGSCVHFSGGDHVIGHSAAKEPANRQDAFRHRPSRQTNNVACRCVSFQPGTTIPQAFSPNLRPIDSLFRHTYAISALWRYQESHRADGLILLGYPGSMHYEPRQRQLMRSGAHVVRCGSDNLGAGRLAGEHLLDRGRKNIAFLGQADLRFPEFQQRYAALAKAIVAAGLEPDRDLVVGAVSSQESGYNAARTLIARGRRFDAIFAGSDLIAIGAMRALAEAGLFVPRDVAVVGFDDIPAASLSTPPLTTVMQDTRLAGEAMVDSVLGQVEGRPPVPRILPTKLIIRASSAG